MAKNKSDPESRYPGLSLPAPEKYGKNEFLSLTGAALAVAPGSVAAALSSALGQITEADPGNIQQVAGAQIRLTTAYYEAALSQAKSSFRWALIAAVSGTALFVAAGGVLLAFERLDVSVLGAIAGGLCQVIAALNFWLYGRAASQLAQFHMRLERMQRFLVANAVAESLDAPARTEAKRELVRLIAMAGSSVAPKGRPKSSGASE